MTTESTQPQPETGSASSSEAGQHPGHRRRRRRRKNKSRMAGAPQAQQQSPESPQPRTIAPSLPPRPAPLPKPQGRKKKKTYQKASSAPAPQPGNSIAPQGGKRKSKQQRGPREFVGPMDHSYRVANGNVADGPASTVQISTNGHNSHYLETYTPAPAPIRADAPTRIFCFIEDLFFIAKIQETARKLGVKVEFIKGDKDAVARLTGVADEERPGLIVFDLNNANAKPLTLIPKFKTKFKKATSIVGFLSHLQGDLKLKAVEAGCDSVMPRSAFSQTLPNLLRRYGLEEEEEYAQQPM